jgi:hypothetical protein
MCKWQMDDPEARVKSSLSECTWLEDLSMDLSSRHFENLWSKKNRGASLLFFLILFYFHLIFSLSFFFLLLFSYFSFLLIIYFFSFSFFSFAPQNFCNIILTYFCQRWCNDSSLMLERCSSSSIKERGNDC